MSEHAKLCHVTEVRPARNLWPSSVQEPSAQQANERIGLFVSDEEWQEIQTNCDFDYIVIGSGFCGLAFIDELLKHNPKARILVLERGANVLPTHVQNLGQRFTALGGAAGETYHWKLSERTAQEGNHCRGMFPFFGGRSTIWSACCPQPSDGKDNNPDELREFPTFMREIQENPQFWDRARDLLRVISASKINNGTFSSLQEKLEKTLEKDHAQIPGVYKTQPTQLSVGPRSDTSNQRFNLFSAQRDLLHLRGPCVRIRLDCPVDNLVLDSSDESAGDSAKLVERISIKGDRIGLPLVNPDKTRVILANSPIPIATLLLNSFPKTKATVGKRFLGHFLSIVVARLPKSLFCFEGKSLQYGANYILGEDPTTKLKYHIQVIAMHSPDPEGDAYDALRECPDYTTAPTSIHLKGSEDYVVFSFTTIAEMTEKNLDNWVHPHKQNPDPTSNVVVQYLLHDDDKKLWDYMDNSTFKTMETIAGKDNVAKIDYWHGVPGEDTGSWESSPKNFRAPAFFHEGSTAYASENPGQDGGSVAPNYCPIWHEDNQLVTARNVHVTGAALFPTVGSWNPTLTMVAYTQALAEDLAKEPEITITTVEPSVNGSELKFALPRPWKFQNWHKRDLLEVGAQRISFEILPPLHQRSRNKCDDEAVLVLWGEVHVGRNFKRRPFSAGHAQKASARLPKTDEPLRAGPHGAVYLHLRSSPKISASDRDKWKGVEDIPPKILLKLPGGGEWKPKWRKYAHGAPLGCDYSDLPNPDLWNLGGIAVEWLDTGIKTPRIGHFQFWVCTKDANCGVHDHNLLNEIFMEVHMGLWPGTGSGISRRAKDGLEVDKCTPNKLDADVNNFDVRLHLEMYDEQGNFWETNPDGTAVRRENNTVKYPYHGWRGGNTKDGIDFWASVEYNPDMHYP